MTPMTEAEIKTALFHIIKESPLMSEVNGVLRKTKRPENSTAEDICISVAATKQDRQEQTAICYVNIYVADQKRGNQYEEDTKRTAALQKLALGALTIRRGHRFKTVVESQSTEQVNGINQHVIMNQIFLKTINE